MDVLTHKIEEDLASLANIKEVKISTSFKEEVLNKLECPALETETVYANWFTPKLQIAAMVVVLLVNAIAIYHLFANQDTSLDNFVEYYSITSKSVF